MYIYICTSVPVHIRAQCESSNSDVSPAVTVGSSTNGTINLRGTRFEIKDADMNMALGAAGNGMIVAPALSAPTASIGAIDINASTLSNLDGDVILYPPPKTFVLLSRILHCAWNAQLRVEVWR